MHITNPDLVSIKTAVRQQAARLANEAASAEQWANLSKNRGVPEAGTLLKLKVTLENSCLTLSAVGLLRALYELATGADESTYTFERASDGDLIVEIEIP